MGSCFPGQSVRGIKKHISHGLVRRGSDAWPVGVGGPALVDAGRPGRRQVCAGRSSRPGRRGRRAAAPVSPCRSRVPAEAGRGRAVERNRRRAGRGLTRGQRAARQVRGREPRGTAWKPGDADSVWSCPGGPRPCEGEKDGQEEAGGQGGEDLDAEGQQVRAAARTAALPGRMTPAGSSQFSSPPPPRRSISLDLLRHASSVTAVSVPTANALLNISRPGDQKHN